MRTTGNGNLKSSVPTRGSTGTAVSQRMASHSDIGCQSKELERNAGNMRQDRIERLEEIGFVWDFKASNWDQMFGQLCEFKRKYGHCLVPVSKVKGKDDEHRALGAWVQTQRQVKRGTRKSGISQDRIDRLEEIGFVWDPRDADWNEKYEELKKFREDNGHCNVPPKFNQKLRSWVDKQRDCYRNGRNGKMRSDRKAKLDSIDFLRIETKSRQLPTKQARKKKVGATADFLRDRAQQQWNESFDRLVEFNKTQWALESSTVV